MTLLKIGFSYLKSVLPKGFHLFLYNNQQIIRCVHYTEISNINAEIKFTRKCNMFYYSYLYSIDNLKKILQILIAAKIADILFNIQSETPAWQRKWYLLRYCIPKICLSICVCYSQNDLIFLYEIYFLFIYFQILHISSQQFVVLGFIRH